MIGRSKFQILGPCSDSHGDFRVVFFFLLSVLSRTCSHSGFNSCPSRNSCSVAVGCWANPLQTFRDTDTVSAYVSSEFTQFLKKEVTFLKSALNFALAGIETRLDEGGGSLLLGDNTGAGTVVLRPIRIQRMLDFGFKLQSVVYIHICDGPG